MADSSAQEQVAPLGYNLLLNQTVQQQESARKTTALTLPFFEDFTGYDVFPDPARWTDRQVYINNTMCVNPVSRGVATFDALNEHGIPYNTFNPFAAVYADSLTSQIIDLSSDSPADSIYLSFFYQPQGNGFAPEADDSLMLFFKKDDTTWVKVWGKEGAAVHPFTPVMIPVRDAFFFHEHFQFRFVNIATINLNDDVWNLDYIRMDKYRTHIDTDMNDICTSLEPSFLLNDYTAMPYRQFLADPGRERATTHQFSIRNNYQATRDVQYSYAARDVATNTALGNGTNSGSMAPGVNTQVSFPAYTATVPISGRYNRVVFEHKYFFNSVSAADRAENDTIIRNQIFDNYLAYDDGTAERSYFLNMWPSLPGKIAIEFHLNEPDTLRGMAIYFGRQVPLATFKYFTLMVYEDIAVNGGTDKLLYEQELNDPGYADTVNKFWVYKFDRPVPLPAGTFYIGTSQPASSGSDSLYFGLDVNRTGGNYLYYNVLNVWESSSVSGALMVRPLLGQPVIGSDVPLAATQPAPWRVYPNPVGENLYIESPDAAAGIRFEIHDIAGRVIKSGTARQGIPISTGSLSPGLYMLRLLNIASGTCTTRIIKL